MSSGPPRLLIALLALVVILPVGAGCSTGASTSHLSAEVLLNERMAAVLLREGRAHEAEMAYRDVLRSDPKNPEMHDGLGVALLIQERVREALEAFDRAVKLDQEKGLFRIHRGMARSQAGLYPEAEEDFRVADASSAPGDKLDVAINRGRMRQRMGDHAGSEEAFTAAIGLDPKSFDARLGRGVAREALREFAAAAEDYLEAVHLQPKNPEANLRLGLVLVAMKKTALGRRYLERTVELDPAGEAGAKARQLLEATPAS